MALWSTYRVMLALLAKPLITLGAPFEHWCQLKETWMPLSDAISLQPVVVAVVAAGVAMRGRAEGC